MLFDLKLDDAKLRKIPDNPKEYVVFIVQKFAICLCTLFANSFSWK